MHCKIFLFANLVSHAKLLGKAADYEVFTDTFDPSRGSFKRGHGHGHKNKSKAATFGERRFGPRPKDQSVFFMMKASDRSQPAPMEHVFHLLVIAFFYHQASHASMHGQTIYSTNHMRHLQTSKSSSSLNISNID